MKTDDILREAIHEYTEAVDPADGWMHIQARVEAPPRRRTHILVPAIVGATAVALLASVVAMRGGANQVKVGPATGVPVAEGTWRSIPEPPFSLGEPGSEFEGTLTTVWTGEEALVFLDEAAVQRAGGDLIGAAYDPETDTWRPISHPGPDVPGVDEAVWTGSQVIVAFSTLVEDDPREGTFEEARFATYDRVAEQWAPVPTPPSNRLAATSLPMRWVGAELVVANGSYDPATETWSQLPDNTPSFCDASAFSGELLMVWGCAKASVDFNDPLTFDARAHVFDPSAGSWRATSPAPVPSRNGVTAVWTGKEFVVWGGYRPGGEYFADGAAYDPASDTWRTLAPAPIDGRESHAVVWSGKEMIVWGGSADERREDGASYDPARDQWSRLPDAPFEWLYGFSPGLWTGSEMLIWNDYGEGAAYRPIVVSDDAPVEASSPAVADPGNDAEAAQAVPETITALTEDGRLVELSSDGTEQTEIADLGATRLSVSAGGELYAVERFPNPSKECDPSVTLVRGDGTTVLEIAHTRGPALSPDGKIIAYGAIEGDGCGAASHLAIRDLQTGRTQTVTVHNHEHVVNAMWAPDGHHVAFTVLNGEAGTISIRVIDVAAPDPQATLRHMGNDEALIDAEALDTSLSEPTYADDGRMFALRHVADRSEIVELDPEAGDVIGVVRRLPDDVTRMDVDPSGEQFLLARWACAEEFYRPPIPCRTPRMLVRAYDDEHEIEVADGILDAVW